MDDGFFDGLTTTFIECRGFNVAGTLEKIKQSTDFMQPIFEALSNALDAYGGASGNKNATSIVFNFSSLMPEGATRRLDFVEIKDSGAGFTDENYNRFLSLNDRSKGDLNKGSGRIQYIKFFSYADFQSVYRDGSSPTGYYKRKFRLSAEPEFLKHNAFVQTCEKEKTDAQEPGTSLFLRLPKNAGQWLRSIEEATVEDVKNRILSRFFSACIQNAILALLSRSYSKSTNKS